MKGFPAGVRLAIRLMLPGDVLARSDSGSPRIGLINPSPDFRGTVQDQLAVPTDSIRVVGKEGVYVRSSALEHGAHRGTDWPQYRARSRSRGP